MIMNVRERIEKETLKDCILEGGIARRLFVRNPEGVVGGDSYNAYVVLGLEGCEVLHIAYVDEYGERNQSKDSESLFPLRAHLEDRSFRRMTSFWESH